MVSSPLLLLFCAALVGASPGRRLQDEAPAPPLWRKLQAKMNIEFCSKNTASELEPCKAEVFQESLKGLSLEEKKMKIDAAISEIEAKKKKKIAMIIHEDSKSIEPYPFPYQTLSGVFATNSGIAPHAALPHPLPDAPAQACASCMGVERPVGPLCSPDTAT